MRIISFKDNYFDENAYLIKDETGITIIDPGFNFKDINEFLKENSLTPSRILLTHGHIDHFGETDLIIKEYGDIPIYISEKDYGMLTDNSINCSSMYYKKFKFESINLVKTVDDKERVESFIFHHTPGHTRGSMVIEYKGFLFTGDTLFKGTIGRTDLPSGSMGDMNYSLKYIISSFKKEIVILPGHGPKSTLKEELKDNMYLNDKRRSL